MINRINELCEKHYHRIVEIRHQIHMYPEVGYEEFKTSQLVVDELTKLGIEVKTNIAKTGVIGLIKGKYPGKTVLLRADMDALKVQEETDIEFKSKVPGVMHACGHDGHTAGLLGAAMILNELKDELHGNVKLMFQPDEEIQGGAKPMIDEGVLENPTVDAAFGAHLWGGVKEGKAGVKHGPMMASPDIFNIKIIGKGGHGGVPQASIDPIPIMSQVINSFQTIVSRKNNPLKPLVISCCYVKSGVENCHNAIPTEALIGGTVRTFDEETRVFAEKSLEEMLKGITTCQGATYEYEYIRQFPPLVNDDKMTDLAATSISKVIGSENVFELEEPSMGGEDFAYIAQSVPSAFVFVGISEDKNHPILHHNSKFSWDDKHMKVLSKSLSQIAIDYLND